MSIKVLIADDSSFQRKIIKNMIDKEEDIEVVGIARNGKDAIQKIGKHNPDVLILDLIMPEMDGFEAFEFLSEHYPIPTIIFSALDPTNLDYAVQALLLGAVDYIQKPKGEWQTELPKCKEQLIEKIIIASKINKNYKMRHETFMNALVEQKNIMGKVIKVDIDKIEKSITKPKEKKEIPILRLNTNIIVMGASVGGPRTLKTILATIPKDFPIPIFIVQHMNEHFMKQFCDSLNNLCKVKVKIPENGELIKLNTIYLAPGGKHMEIIMKNNKPGIRTFEGQPVNFCIPSVDVLFFSAAKIYGKQCMGILLTGMGSDGVEGLRAIKEMGGRAITESKETCILYGMPKIAAETGAAELIIPNYKVQECMVNFSKKVV
ncbi:MAG: chemotaxis-specific protein-glutamate methyltransferase CheB [Promethearchaeota archaeon]